MEELKIENKQEYFDKHYPFEDPPKLAEVKIKSKI